MRKEIIEEISKKLEECKRKNTFEVQIEKTKWNNPRVLSFCMRSTKVPDFIDFDVLPAYNALGQLISGYKPPPEVYLRLIRDASPGENFSSCFTELQREFIISRPTKVKSFIRLVKHWYKTKLHGNRNVPPKYAFELLSIYAWEKGSNGQPRFNMAQSFRNFLELICNYRELCVWWTENYNLYDNAELGEFLEEQIEKPRPVILDPADPTGNFGVGYNWELVAIEAESCLSTMRYRTSAEQIRDFRDLPPTLPDSLISRSPRYVPRLNSWSTDADNESSPPPTQQETSGTYCTIL
ncbi:2'-5'-oligoadenylate synthase 1-like [Ambystoma mexicanum]|uniref:2'-5'-oligoadenylate synthase 1-like n=1 Tax=Ambystoma mexicanum TaxID=8296 RepID=UPI0037E75481